MQKVSLAILPCQLPRCQSGKLETNHNSLKTVTWYTCPWSTYICHCAQALFHCAHVSVMVAAAHLSLPSHIRLPSVSHLCVLAGQLQGLAVESVCEV